MIFENKISFSKTIWISKQGGFLSRDLPHINKFSDSNVFKRKLIEERRFFFRWDTFINDCNKKDFWYHVIKDSPEDWFDYSSKMRNQIKKGLKLFYTKIISKEYIIKNGYSCYLESLERYKTKPEKKCFFDQSVKSSPNDTEFYGLFDNDNKELVGFSENIIQNKGCFYSSFWLENNALNNYGTYVLVHEMNKYYLNEKKFNFVSDGSRSILHPTKIQYLLINKFKFRKAPVKLNIVYFPGIKIFLNLLTNLYPLLKFLWIQKLNAAIIQNKYANR